MNSYILSIDLGTTLIKIVLYNNSLVKIGHVSYEFELIKNSGYIEFCAKKYWQSCVENIKKLFQNFGVDSKKVEIITLTGQAETLILLDKDNQIMMNAISWLDNRSLSEVEILKQNFDINEVYRITGEPDIITTWPITKILWLKNNMRDTFDNVNKFLLLKDYIIYKFTNKFVSEFTTYNYSYYFDIIKKQYWKEILDFTDINVEQLPELLEPGEIIENLSNEVVKELGLSNNTVFCIGCNDQMAGMLGVGNISEGIISENTGTVIAISTLIKDPTFKYNKIPILYNAIKNTYVTLLVCESGGISLEWFRKSFYPDKDYEYINNIIKKIPKGSDNLIFLPYLTGTNTPDLDKNAKGVFYGINLNHDVRYFARAVMEGIGYLIKKNLDFLINYGFGTEKIITLGGGSKSKVWNQIKADILNKEIVVTNINEPASFGATILSAVNYGLYKNYETAIKNSVKTKEVYLPENEDIYKKYYKLFLHIYNNLKPVYNLNSSIFR